MLLEDTAYIFFYSGTQIPSSYCSAKKKKSVILLEACRLPHLYSDQHKEERGEKSRAQYLNAKN